MARTPETEPEKTGEGQGLVARAIGGDPEALDALWRQSAPWVSAVALAYLPRGEPVEGSIDDVLQEVAMAAVKGISTLRTPDHFEPWLRSIAMNISRSAGRKVSRRRGREGHAPMRPRGVDGTGRDDLRAAMALMQDLPDHAREVLMLRAARGLSQDQIARVLGVPVKTVETRLRRARKALRSSMADSAGSSKSTCNPAASWSES